jgi:quinol monooxygenase YgiN
VTSSPPLRAGNLFIYYRVRPEHRANAEAAVRALQAEWQARDASLRCELLRRTDDKAADNVPSVTLMEIYRRDGGFDDAARRRIDEQAAAALAPWLASPRHTEVFESCA